MGVPKKRTSKAVRDKRRSHDALTPPTVVKCSNCGEPTQPHHACLHCGHYKGRDVLHRPEAEEGAA